MSDQAIEQEIQAKGLTAARVTPADIEAAIASEHYFAAAEGIAPSVSKMVDRFLGWKLPADFGPDCGISFKRESDYEHPVHGRSKFEPVGTNLFTADQAKQMFMHCVAAPEVPQSLGMLTFCVLVLRNGFTVTGENACSDVERFDPKIGRKIAREDAINKVWSLMKYELKSRLHAAAHKEG